MSLRFLLDANVLSEPTRKRPDAKVLEKLARFQSVMATASIVWNEMLAGAGELPASRKKELLQDYISGIPGAFPILPYDRAAAEWHAVELVRLKGLGRPAPFADGQIAAIAKVNSLALVTNNERDFRHFKDLEVVNWHK